MRETTIGRDFVGPAVLECKTEDIGKIDEIYRGERGREQRWALVNAGPCSSRKMVKEALCEGCLYVDGPRQAAVPPAALGSS
jgi:hypothetical protein